MASCRLWQVVAYGKLSIMASCRSAEFSTLSIDKKHLREIAEMMKRLKEKKETITFVQTENIEPCGISLQSCGRSFV